MPILQPPVELGPSPGVTTPGQFGPISRVFFPRMALFTFTMSLTGMPSVMQTTKSSPASTASRIASAAKGGGTKMAEAVAPVCWAASATLSKIGTFFSKSWPPLPGVTPATICVPYSRLSCVCRAPKLPVMPWTSTRVVSVTRIAIGEFTNSDLRFTIFLFRQCAEHGERIFVLFATSRFFRDYQCLQIKHANRAKGHFEYDRPLQRGLIVAHSGDFAQAIEFAQSGLEVKMLQTGAQFICEHERKFVRSQAMPRVQVA